MLPAQISNRNVRETAGNQCSTVKEKEGKSKVLSQAYWQKHHAGDGTPAKVSSSETSSTDVEKPASS
jgi:hypothetical protein